jgi:hypothetical protein
MAGISHEGLSVFLPSLLAQLANGLWEGKCFRTNDVEKNDYILKRYLWIVTCEVTKQ